MACKYTYNGVEYSKEQLVSKLSNEKSNFNTLYSNLVNEITNTETGRKVLDRIKRDYQFKNDGYNKIAQEAAKSIVETRKKLGQIPTDKELEIASNVRTQYTLEEQQEEAIVELLGLMTAEKLDKVKDGKLISLLKRLLKEIKAFMKDILFQKEVEIDKLPDNMTLGDLSDLLAYSNSKLILPGYMVEYTTPDNMKFKTYQEASNHISDLAKSVEDVDLGYIKETYFKEKEEAYLKFKKEFEENQREAKKAGLPVAIGSMKFSTEHGFIQDIKGFIEKNKEYEQSKEIIEEWKKVNNIQYNPEEIYSRGQEFVSVVGAYSSFDVNLMMQNLLSHIEDNEKAGGKFAISAYTKPINRQIEHLESGGGKIKFKIYPQSNDILWAANTDVYSGSVWDASEKVNKDKKSELLGVSYTKYPALHNVNAVQPNLASVVDDLAHHHNELGITLTGNNFRLEYDEDIPYATKKIIDGINKILDQKYGKLVKPEIKDRNMPNSFEYWEQDINEDGGMDRYRISVFKKENKWFREFFNTYGESEHIKELTKSELKEEFNIALISNSTITKQTGIQPTQTKETLKESIDSVKNKVVKYNEGSLTDKSEFTEISEKEYNEAVQKGKKGFGLGTSSFGYSETYDYNGYIYTQIDYNKETGLDTFGKIKKDSKEYTSQALINTKIAALKEVAKKYPRVLIRSEVRRSFGSPDIGFENDELPFQKIPNSLSKEQSDAIDNVFDENPELANAVYSVLGFKVIKESDITYTDEEGKTCAEMGLTTNQNPKFGDWEIIKDLKGSPTHKQGGIDLSIKGNTIEAEGNELVLKNSVGDLAIIPKKDRLKIKDLIADNNEKALNNYISALPKNPNKAGDGGIYSDKYVKNNFFNRIFRRNNILEKQIMDENRSLYNVGKLKDFKILEATGKSKQHLEKTNRNPEYFPKGDTWFPYLDDVSQPIKLPNKNKYRTLVNDDNLSDDQLKNAVKFDFISHSLHNDKRYNDLSTQLSQKLLTKYDQKFIDNNGGVDAYVRGILSDSEDYKPYKDETSFIEPEFINEFKNYIKTGK